MAKNRNKLTLLSFMTALCSGCDRPPPQPVQISPIELANTLSTVFEDAARRISPSVVTVFVGTPRERTEEQPSPLKSEAPPEAAPPEKESDEGALPKPPGQDDHGGVGTGVVFDGDGHILTNHHVIGRSKEIWVGFGGKKRYRAKRIGTDPKVDLAVLKVDAPEAIPAKFGDSDALRLGEWVLAVGTPFGLEQSISAGIISAKGRFLFKGSDAEDYIQTDAAINPGNSGGPLVNLRGEVVGINTAILSRSGGSVGVGFAVSINLAKRKIDEILKKGAEEEGGAAQEK